MGATATAKLGQLGGILARMGQKARHSFPTNGVYAARKVVSFDGKQTFGGNFNRRGTPRDSTELGLAAHYERKGVSVIKNRIDRVVVDAFRSLLTSVVSRGAARSARHEF